MTGAGSAHIMPRLFLPAGCCAMLPRLIEPRRFAQQGLSVAGKVPVSALLRLGQAVQESSEPEVDLRFFVDDAKLRCVSGTVKVDVVMVCQR